MTRSRSARAWRLLLLTLAGAIVIGLTTLGRGLLDPAIGPLAAPPDWLLIAELVAGGVLLGAGVIALVADVTLVVGGISILAGAAWFAGGLGRMADELPLTRASTAAATVMLMPLVVAVLVAMTARDRGGRSWRWTTSWLIIALVVGIVTVLTYRPWDDPRCTDHCFELDALVAIDAGTRTLLTLAQLLVAGASAIALVVIGLCGIRIRSDAGPSRLAHAGGTVVGAAVLGWLALGIVVAARGGSSPAPAGDDRIPAALAILAGRAQPGDALLRLTAEGWMTVQVAGITALGLAAAWRATRAAEARSSVRRLAEGIASAPSPGQLTAVLATALRDPELRLWYRVADPHDDRLGMWLVEADGRSLDVGACPEGRVRTPIVRDGEELAVVEHRADIDPASLRDGLGASALVALDSERLGSARLVQLRELQASRARIVDLQDEVRRRIERDVHDGAQQRLLAIAFRLRFARMDAEADGRRDATRAFERAEACALGIVDELRRICRGIHPQALAESGLEDGLASLRDEAPLLVGVRIEPGPRPPLRVEVAIYEAVQELTGLAVARGAPRLDVGVSRTSDRLLLDVIGPPTQPITISDRLSDRLGAVGAEIIVGGAADGRWMRAVLPCA